LDIPPHPACVGDFPFPGGRAAVAVLELLSGDKPVYTDMLSLYKFDDGWKIVTKIFYAYPRS